MFSTFYFLPHHSLFFTYRESENWKQTTHLSVPSLSSLYYSINTLCPFFYLSLTFCHSVGSHRHTAVSSLGVLVRENPQTKNLEETQTTSLLGFLHTPQCRLSKTKILASMPSKPRFASSPISPNPVSSLFLLPKFQSLLPSALTQNQFDEMCSGLKWVFIFWFKVVVFAMKVLILVWF